MRLAGFDWLYAKLFVQPFVYLARLNQSDVIDLFYTGIAQANQRLHGLLSRSQTGLVRWYAAGMTVGAILIILIVVFL